MFRVSAVLRRYDADVPPTAVGATPSMLECTFNAFVSARLLDGGTQWMPLSAAINNPTSGEGVDGTFQHRSACVDDKHCLRASGGEVGRPAHRATELGRR